MAIPATAVGAFADLGGSVTTVLSWSPDLHEVEGALVAVAGYFEKLEAPLRASSRIVKQDIQKNFDTETDPRGNRWKELGQDYLDWKESEGYDLRILRRTGALEKAATSFSRFVVEEHSGNLWYNTTGLPDYWRVHQEGTSSEATEALKLSKQAAEILGEDTTDFPNIGRGKNIAARPYIGVSDEAEEMIFNAFDIWFAEGVSIFVSSAGVMHERVGGRIGPTIDLNG